MHTNILCLGTDIMLLQTHLRHQIQLIVNKEQTFSRENLTKDQRNSSPQQNHGEISIESL